MAKNSSTFFKKFLPFAIVISGVFLTMYGTIQQSYRQSANDPQIQIAEDSAQLLQQGIKPEAVTPGKQIDISQSLATFVIVFDKNGTPLTSSGLLNNQIPTPPPGVFEYTKQHKEDRLTWQPKSGVRIATVIKPYTSGYVLVGRSLREVEERENKLTMQIGIGYIITLLATAFSLIIF